MASQSPIDELNVNFQHVFESLVFENIRASNCKTSPSLRADIQRKTLSQLYYASNSRTMLVHQFDCVSHWLVIC